MLVYNELIAFFTKYEVLAITTFPNDFVLLETFAAIITKEPVVIQLFRWG